MKKLFMHRVYMSVDERKKEERQGGGELGSIKQLDLLRAIVKASGSSQKDWERELTESHVSQSVILTCLCPCANIRISVLRVDALKSVCAFMRLNGIFTRGVFLESTFHQ